MSKTEIVTDLSYFSSLVLESVRYTLKPGNGEIARALRKSVTPETLATVSRLRKLLHLGKIIKHNGKFYSSLAIPGIPSRAYANSVKNGVLNFFDAGTPLKKQIDTALLAITPTVR